MYSLSKRRKGAPIPRNEIAVQNARDSINQLAPMFQRQLLNATRVDGHECLLYIPKTTGVRCSCRISDPLDANGHMRPEMLDALVVDAGVHLDFFGAADNPKTVSTDARPQFRAPANGSFSSEIFDDEDDDYDLDAPFQGSTALVDLDTTESRYTPRAQISALNCPVCYGVGWVGGYDLYGGGRITLGVQAFELHGCVIDRSDSPITSAMAPGSLMAVEVMLPKAAQELQQISVFAGSDLVRFNLSCDGTTIEPAQLIDFFDGRRHRLQFTILDTAKVTHVSIQYGSEPLRIDVSPHSLSTQNDRLDQRDDVQLAIPLVLSRDLKSAIVYDGTENQFYRIQDTTINSTCMGLVLNLQLSARVVQNYEVQSTLPRLKRTSKSVNGSFTKLSNTRGYYG